MSNFQACSLFGSILSGRPGCVCGGTLFGGTHAASSAFGSKSSAVRLSSWKWCSNSTRSIGCSGGLVGLPAVHLVAKLVLVD